MWFLWLPRLEKTPEELKCESMSQLYAWGHSSLCSEAFDELIWENVKWRGMTAFQFRLTIAFVQVLQVRTNPVVSSRVLESSRLPWKPAIHLCSLRIQTYVSLFITTSMEWVTCVSAGVHCTCQGPIFTEKRQSFINHEKAAVIYSSLPIKFKWLLHGLPTLGLSENRAFCKCAHAYCILCAEKSGTSM